MTGDVARANPIIADFLRRSATPPAAEWLHALNNMAAGTWLNDQIDAALFDEADCEAMEKQIVAEARRQLTEIVAAEAARLTPSVAPINPIMEAFRRHSDANTSQTEWLHALDRMNEGTAVNRLIFDALLVGSHSPPMIEKLTAEARRQLTEILTAPAPTVNPRLHTFTVTIEADTVELAGEALSERLSYDEDHGYDYLFVAWGPASA